MKKKIKEKEEVTYKPKRLWRNCDLCGGRDDGFIFTHDGLMVCIPCAVKRNNKEIGSEVKEKKAESRCIICGEEISNGALKCDWCG